MAKRKTIEEFGLTRSDKESYYMDEYTFLVPFAGPLELDSEWICRQVDDPNEEVLTDFGIENDPWGLTQYAINSSKKIYVVFTAFLEAEYGNNGRKTDMRLWQMIVDNWIHAGNTPDSLRYVGISGIVNHEVRAAMDDEWQHQIDQAETSSVTWDKNSFVRSGLRVVESLSTAEKTLMLGKVHLIRNGYGLNGRYLVLELKNGDANQENYREKLIRTLLPMTTHNLVQKQVRREAGMEWEKVVFFPPDMYPGDMWVEHRTKS